MKPFLLILALVGLVCAGDRHGDSGPDFNVEQRDSLQKSLSFSNPAAPKTVRIDNVWGFVHVSGYDGATVEISGTRLARAESQERLKQAADEVQLKLTERDDTIEAYVDGPFRCGDGGIHNRGRRYYGYEVRYDFEVKVPRASKVWIRNVNGGEVTLDRVSGGYDVENVNGGITMHEVAGAGRAYAVNGGVRITFSDNPHENSFFGSLNGVVEAVFKPGLSADLRFKTFNGGVYTDFPITYLPLEPGKTERRDGKFIYKSNAFTGARIGAGGPELKFDAFNGNIRILQKEN